MAVGFRGSARRTGFRGESPRFDSHSRRSLGWNATPCLSRISFRHLSPVRRADRHRTAPHGIAARDDQPPAQSVGDADCAGTLPIPLHHFVGRAYAAFLRNPCRADHPYK